MKQAVVLVGGLGTRLGARARLVPKPLQEVAGRPFLDYVLDELARYPTIEEILLLAGHLAGQVVERYESKRWRNSRISVVSEPAQFGTGGALKHAASLLDREFLLMNGELAVRFQHARPRGQNRGQLSHRTRRAEAGS